MATKKKASKVKKTLVSLGSEDPRELEMILDRLLVQNPEGESLKNYLRSLSRVLAGRENLVLALIEKLSKSPTEVGFEAFLSLKDLVEGRHYGRTIKQAYYRFRQKGYRDDSGSSSSGKIVLIPKETRAVTAHLTTASDTFWLISALIPESGHPSPTAVAAFPEDGFRTMNVRVTESSQRGYREFIQGIASDASRKVVDIPVWHAARLFFDLLKFCGGSARGGISSDVDRAKRSLESFFDPERKPYVYELMPALDEHSSRLGETSKKDLLEAAFSTWLFFPRDKLLPYWEKAKELESSLLVIPREVQRERTLDVIKTAANNLCAGDARILYQRFFEEQALSFKLSSKDDLAMSAWIVAQQLAGGAASGSISLICDLVVLSMKEHWHGELKDEEDEDEDEAAFVESDSGIILPK